MVASFSSCFVVVFSQFEWLLVPLLSTCLYLYFQTGIENCSHSALMKLKIYIDIYAVINPVVGNLFGILTKSKLDNSLWVAHDASCDLSEKEIELLNSAF